MIATVQVEVALLLHTAFPFPCSWMPPTCRSDAPDPAARSGQAGQVRDQLGGSFPKIGPLTDTA